MMAQRVAAMFDELRDQVVAPSPGFPAAHVPGPWSPMAPPMAAMVQEYEQQESQMMELQGQTQRVEALEAELQGLRHLLGQDAGESEAETCTPPSLLGPRPRKREKLKPCQRPCPMSRRLLMAVAPSPRAGGACGAPAWTSGASVRCNESPLWAS